MDDDHEDGSNENAKAYWRANLKLLGWLMSIWFLVSFGAGILFRDFLDQFMIGGFPLGFWFAQQGSIYVFIALIVFYAWKMHWIERHYALDDDGDELVDTSQGENPPEREGA